VTDAGKAHHEHSGWRDYRRRRAVVLAGLVVGPALVGALHIAHVGALPLLCSYIICGMHLLLSVGVLKSFPCPACEEFWFRWPHITRADPSLLGLLWHYWTHKQCSHCGLPKFMNPEGWDKTELHE